MEIELKDRMNIEYEDPVFWNDGWVNLETEQNPDGSSEVFVKPEDRGRVVGVAERDDQLARLGIMTGWPWERTSWGYQVSVRVAQGPVRMTLMDDGGGKMEMSGVVYLSVKDGKDLEWIAQIFVEAVDRMFEPVATFRVRVEQVQSAVVEVEAADEIEAIDLASEQGGFDWSYVEGSFRAEVIDGGD